MITLVKNWNINCNYWEVNPTITSIKVFREFYNNDKSKDKSNSSKIMWAIALLVDPNESNSWRNIDYPTRYKEIPIDYLEDKKFSFDNYKELIDAYERFCITVPERELVKLENKLIQRSDFIDITPYSLDYMEQDEESGKFKLIKGTAKQLDDLLLNTEKIYDKIKHIKNRIEKEEIRDTYGGLTLSDNDKPNY